MRIPTARSIGLAILLLLGVAVVPQAATGTLMPAPWLLATNSSGAIVSGAKLCTYVAGTSTPVATYSDVNLSVSNGPVVTANSAGIIGPVYLTPGQSYKLILQDATGTAGVCDGAVIRTQDNVAAIPTASSNIDITGTAGEALTAGQVVYLSDGSGSKVAGQWYKADSANYYSSLTPQIGMVPSSISSGATGSIRLSGQMTGLSVSVGNTYYIGTAGALTSTAPVQARIVGVADSATTVIFPKTPIPIQNWVDDFRLTLTTGTPVTVADVTAATTIYCSPYTGNRIDLPDSAGNPMRVTSAEFSIAVPATTSQMYDVFAYNNSGVATLELLAWSSDTARATTVTRTTAGRLLKNGDPTRMYLGSVRTTTVSGQTEDSNAKRYLWNMYNRRPVTMRVTDSTDSFTYSTGSYQQWNAAAGNQLDLVVGQAEDPAQVIAIGYAANSGGNPAYMSIAYDSTTVPTTGVIGQGDNFQAAGQRMPFTATLMHFPAVGRHVYVWLQKAAAGTTTWYGDNGDATSMQSGISGIWQR